ncbi:hypothetical protein ACSBR1_006215 [Camellia fascicularis]
MIASPIPQSSPILLFPSSKTTLKDSQNVSPPVTALDSQGDNGGGSSNYEDLRGYALWAISYGIAAAIALRTIDALTSSRHTGGHEIAQQKKEKEKTSSGDSNPPPSICHIVFPSVTLINPTTTTSPDKGRNCSSLCFTKFTKKIGECIEVLVDLVIDHSVQVDVARSENAVETNMGLEFQRNKERFAFLKWGSNAFHNMLIVPPGSGIVHQEFQELAKKTLLQVI